jgi:GMP synthase (glutamine-hydrolysing)
MGLRFLVIEGNTRADREKHRNVFGLTPSDSYVEVVRGLSAGAICDIAYPADERANIPDGGGLAGYDGIFLTGSALNIYDATPPIMRQVELMRAIYASQTPCFGSCWGIQVATVAAGGDVRSNAKGREIGFARNIAPTQDGLAHPMLAGRPRAFDAPAVHLDTITVLPPNATVLAANALTQVQAAEIVHGGGCFWGVQYHPEFDLRELAAILGRMADKLVEEGFCASRDDALAYVRDIEQLHSDPARTDLAWRYGLDAQVLDPVLRLTEIRNFITYRVQAAKSAHQRGKRSPA